MDNPRLRVSIVIPAHNEERHLRACLDAIAAQIVPVYEVIVADNNSTDKTAAIAKEYDFVKVVKELRQGRVFARNAGFDAASGDIIGRIDADIVLPRDWVRSIQQFYANERNRLTAWTGAGYFYNVRMPRLVSWAFSLFAFDLNKLLLGHYSLWGSNMALPRLLWWSVREDVCLRNDVHEDLDLAMHLADKDFIIYYDTDVQTQVHAELRRVHSDRHELWDYLNWWPRALRIHGNRLWPVAWFFGAAVLYCAALVLVAAEKLSGAGSKKTARSDAGDRQDSKELAASEESSVID
ncbi:MAG TPA: glycosyltransferase family 2 protein [Candidatus Saccharimonadales bacterium]